MKAKPLHYHLETISAPDPTFRVTVTRGDGVAEIGTIRFFYVRHLEMYGWEANAADGHLAVHEHRWQALWALTWDRKGYPFPVARTREREVILETGRL